MEPLVCILKGIVEGDVTEGTQHKLLHNSNRTFHTALHFWVNSCHLWQGRTWRWYTGPQDDVPLQEHLTRTCLLSGAGHHLKDSSLLQLPVELLLVSLASIRRLPWTLIYLDVGYSQLKSKLCFDSSLADHKA